MSSNERPDHIRRGTELHDAASHAYEVGAMHGKQDNLSDHEQSRLAEERAHDHHHQDHNGLTEFGHAEIEALAHQYFLERNGAQGSADEDWFRAVKELRSRNIAPV